jgi:glutathione S-transferase
MDPSAKKQKVEPKARLYSKTFASSARVENIIHELGIEDQVAIEPLTGSEENKKEWYRKLHPQGKVCVLPFLL